MGILGNYSFLEVLRQKLNLRAGGENIEK